MSQGTATTATTSQAYRLKAVRFRDRECQILLQNENGPCPLLAAANALLLQEKIKLPASAIRNNVASLSDLTNVLANFALQSGNANTNAAMAQSFYLDELLQQIPKLEHGMDVNPKFTSGIMGYEFTQQLTCFDLWHVKLVHGWLLDPVETPQPQLEAIGGKSYNELIELLIQGREAEATQETIRSKLQALRETQQQQQQQVPASEAEASERQAAALKEIIELEEQLEGLQNEATRASYIDHFLETTGHQLTQYGLTCLHQDLANGELAVFFRNNHFATLTKHDGSLFLLVTDLGYATTPMIVWERLDVIDGDTEYVNSSFTAPAPGQMALQTGSSLTPEQLLAQSSQNDADYHLALQLSSQPSQASVTPQSQAVLDTEEGKLMAAATEASLREYHGQQQADPPVSPTTPPTAAGAGGPPTAAVGVPLSQNPTTSPQAQQTLQPQQQQQQQAMFSNAATGTPTMVPPAAATTEATSGMTSQEAADAMLAQQLAQELQQQQQQPPGGPPPLSPLQQQQAALLNPQQQQALLIVPNHDDDYQLARQLQEEEERRAAASIQQQQTRRAQQVQQQQHQLQQQQQQQQPGANAGSSSASGSGSGGKCVIS